MCQKRRGLTLVEFCVVVAIVGVLVALAIPAVQSYRESARRATCGDRMRQLAIAISSYESAQRSLPSLYHGKFSEFPRPYLDDFHSHSWRTALLPQLERQALYQKIDLARSASAAANQPNLKTRLSVFVCPSTPDSDALVSRVYARNDADPSRRVTTIVGTAARSDYEALGGIRRTGYHRKTFADARYEFGLWGETSFKNPETTSSYRPGRYSDCKDGLSTTLLVVERAGVPDYYRKGKLVAAYPQQIPGPTDPDDNWDYLMDPHQAAWGLSTAFHFLTMNRLDAAVIPAVNEHNNGGIYGFHRGGANVSFGDGSVRLLSEFTDTETLKALATRSGGETIDLGEFGI